MRYIFLIFFMLTLGSCGVFLQKNGMKAFKLPQKIKDKDLNKYQYDFVYMSQLLEEGFPKLDSIFPKGEREKQKSFFLKQLNHPNTTNKDFLLQAQKYLGNVHNQHTNVNLKSTFEYYYPFKVFNSYGDLYLRNIERTQDSLLIGKKIISINGFPIKEVQKRLRQFSSSENEIGQLADLRWYYYYYKVDYLKEIKVISGHKDRLVIKFEDGTSAPLNAVNGSDWDLYSIKERPHPLTRSRKDIYSYHVFPEANFGYMQYLACYDRDEVLQGIGAYVKPWLQPVARAYVKRQFKKKKPSKRVAPYFNQKHPIFKDFVWEMVDSLNNSGVEHLIIDLRRNSGGQLNLGIELLYFLTDRKDVKGFKEYTYTSRMHQKYFPGDYREFMENQDKVPEYQLVLRSDGQDLFTKVKDSQSIFYIPPNRPIFKGKVYVLANYQTGSAAAMLATLFQDNQLATIIGTHVGNNPTGPTTFTPMKLPKTKAYFGMASSYQIRADESKGLLLEPDYWVEYTIDDLAKGRDPFLQKAMELIKQSGAQK